MRAIMIMFDTLTRSYLPNYGNDWVIAPNFQRLEEHCVTFDHFYGGSMPCMPARRELHTGKLNFLHRSWGPLEPFDISVVDQLKNHGIYTHLITDHSHYFEDGGATYHNRYNSWEGFRGQEGDRWQPRDIDLELPRQHPLTKSGVSFVQHYANRQKQRREEDYSSIKTMNAGLEFLQSHGNRENWFVQVECFDPHEPFVVPQRYRDLYGLTQPPRLNWPVYGPLTGKLSLDELEDLRKEYAALISMCDAYLGKILDFMDDHEMWKDTLLIVNTDHGFLLGEHDWLGKNKPPLYNEIVHLPCFIHVPGQPENQRRSALAQTVDIPATLLDYFAVPPIAGMAGCSLLPVVSQDREIHDAVLFGIFGGHVNVTDGEWLYMRANRTPDNQPLAEYTLMPTHMREFFSREELNGAELVRLNQFSHQMPVLRIPCHTDQNSALDGDFLFHLTEDPKQKQNLIDDRPQERARMIRLLKEKMIESEAPREQWIRMGLSQTE